MNKVTKTLLLFNLENHQYLYYKPWDDEWTHNPEDAREFNDEEELIKFVEECEQGYLYEVDFEIKTIYHVKEVEDAS